MADLPSLTVEPLGPAPSLRDRAYAALKKAIASADIYAHAEEIRLDERQLGEALGVSRTPIREAMTVLEQEGFVRTVPRRGVFIVRKTEREIVEMIQVWGALESMAARLATEHATAEGIAGLHRIMDQFTSDGPAAHIHEYSDANIAFHQAIIRLGGSELIARMSENLFIHVRAIRHATISRHGRAERSLREHMAIIAALEARNADLAGRLVRDHALGLAAFVQEHGLLAEHPDGAATTGRARADADAAQAEITGPSRTRSPTDTPLSP